MLIHYLLVVYGDAMSLRFLQKADGKHSIPAELPGEIRGLINKYKPDGSNPRDIDEMIHMEMERKVENGELIIPPNYVAVTFLDTKKSGSYMLVPESRFHR